MARLPGFRKIENPLTKTFKSTDQLKLNLFVAVNDLV
jgi:hypothetical protein